MRVWIIAGTAMAVMLVGAIALVARVLAMVGESDALGEDSDGADGQL